MTWVLIRQHRAQFVVLGAILAASAVLFAISHHFLGAVPYKAAPLHLDNIDRVLVSVSIGMPLLLGAFLGATIVAREAEHGTNALLWTQTVTRRRWLASTLASAFAATIVWSTLLSVLITWWSHRWFTGGGRFEALQFDTQNVAPVAYACFAVALGFAAGALLRRMLPAVGVTVGAFLVARIAVEVFARPHLAPTQTVVSGMPKVLGDAWVVSQHALNPDGSVYKGRFDIPTQCLPFGPSDVGRCIQNAGYRFVTTIQPDSHYWRIQWTESGIFVALAAALVAVGVIATLRRDA